MLLKQTKSPIGNVCKDCPDRYIGCHGECEKYISAKKKYQEKRHEEFISRNACNIGFSNNKARSKEARMRCYRNYGV